MARGATFSINAHHARIVKIFSYDLICTKIILHEYYFHENLLDEKKRITVCALAEFNRQIFFVGDNFLIYNIHSTPSLSHTHTHTLSLTHTHSLSHTHTQPPENVNQTVFDHHDYYTSTFFAPGPAADALWRDLSQETGVEEVDQSGISDLHLVYEVMENVIIVLGSNTSRG